MGDPNRRPSEIVQRTRSRPRTDLHLLSTISIPRPERTCGWLAEAIAAARKKWNFALWAYVFMPEHVHLIICPRDSVYEVSAILSAIKEPVGRTAVKYLEVTLPDWLPRITRIRGGRTGSVVFVLAARGWV